MNSLRLYTPNIQKIIQKLNLVYNSCIISKQTCELQSIIPLFFIDKYASHLNFCKYLYIPLNNILINDYQNFRFTINPEPTHIFYENKGGKMIKGGIFTVIYLSGQIGTVTLLYNSRVFLKWHFLKYLEINKINLINNTNKYVNSDEYLHNVVLQIKKIDNENIYDATGNYIII